VINYYFIFLVIFYFWEFLDLKYLIFDLFKGFLNEKKDPKLANFGKRKRKKKKEKNI